MPTFKYKLPNYTEKEFSDLIPIDKWIAFRNRAYFIIHQGDTIRRLRAEIKKLNKKRKLK